MLELLKRSKRSNFILETNMAELNQNQNSKKPDRPDAMWNLYFTLEIKNSTFNAAVYTCFTESLF